MVATVNTYAHALVIGDRIRSRLDGKVRTVEAIERVPDPNHSYRSRHYRITLADPDTGETGDRVFAASESVDLLTTGYTSGNW